MDRRKKLVRDAYDSIAEKWGRERDAIDDPRERAWLERFCASLIGDRVLDLGCGGGALLARLVARGLHVTGVDFSRAQLDRARATCPSALLVQGDLAEVAFARAIFDGAIIYDSLWHLPREEHGVALLRIRRWVGDGAPLLLTVGALATTDPSDLHTQLCGAPIYYSGWPRDTTLDLLRGAGFDLVAFDESPERALVVLARALAG